MQTEIAGSFERNKTHNNTQNTIIATPQCLPGPMLSSIAQQMLHMYLEVISRIRFPILLFPQNFDLITGLFSFLTLHGFCWHAFLLLTLLNLM